MTDLFVQLSAELAPTYRLERELGGGGMSRVFLAEEPRLGRRVVIKLLPPDASAGLPADRFEREIRLAASLQHPNLVPVLNAGAAAGLVYYVMPYITGESLAARIGREGALPVSETIRILRDVADALAYAHAQGVVHRDVKPDNILLTGRHALVTDFGVAKAVSAAADARPRTTLTEAGFTLGTPAYMAPEQATADPHLDHRADLYALGVVAYEMLAGRTPFAAPTPQGMIAAHVAVVPEPVDRYRPGIPSELSGVVMRCLEKHPADRWQTAEALGAALEPAGVAPIPVTPASLPAAAARPGGSPGRVLAAFALATVVVTGLAFALSRLAGLPDWVWLAAFGCMAAGLPVILYTGRIERRRAGARATGGLHPSGQHIGERLFTWRRAVLGGALALGTLLIVAVGWAVSRELGIGPAATLLSAGTLDPRDRLVLADFANRTGDSALGDAVTEALRVDLAQSRVVRLLDVRQVAGVLQRMGVRPDTALGEALAREVAVREGAKGVVAGEVTPLGSGYVLTARIITADSGTTLAPVRVTADDAAGLIGAVNELSGALRERIGESLRTIRGGEPLERVTTASLPALRLYTEGTRRFNAGDYIAARGYLERAVAVDSGFAMAWRKLGAAYFNSGAPEPDRLDAARRAFRHRDRLPPVERHLAEAYYYTDAEPQPEAAIAAYRAVLELVPDEFTALNNLGMVLNREGRFAEAEELLRRGIELDGPMTLFINLNHALISQRKWTAADSFARLADSVAPETHAAPVGMRLDIARARRDFPAQDSLIELAQQEDLPLGFRRYLLWNRLAVREAQGRFHEAAELAREIGRNAAADENRGSAAAAATVPILHEIFRGRHELAKAELAAFLADPVFRNLPDSVGFYPYVGLLYGLLGDPAGVARVRGVWERAKPPALRSPHEPVLWDAYEAQAEQRWPDAAAAFSRAATMRHCSPCGVFFAAQAWDRAGVGDSAIAYYLRGIETPVTEDDLEDGLMYPVALRRLGALYEERGERAEAIAWYQRFVALWRDADPELQAAVREVRERLARLVAEPRGT